MHVEGYAQLREILSLYLCSRPVQAYDKIGTIVPVFMHALGKSV